jgi:hypothetical protein
VVSPARCRRFEVSGVENWHAPERLKSHADAHALYLRRDMVKHLYRTRYGLVKALRLKNEHRSPTLVVVHEKEARRRGTAHVHGPEKNADRPRRARVASGMIRLTPSARIGSEPKRDGMASG